MKTIPQNIMEANNWVSARWVGEHILAIMPMTFGKFRLTIGKDYLCYEKGY